MKKKNKALRSSKRKTLKTIGKAALVVGAANFMPMPWVRKAEAADSITIGILSLIHI
mgnify:CR=1 FL=1